MIFPCSDFRHAVMKPAGLLMSEYLMRCPVLSVRDAAIGSFLCSIVLLVGLIFFVHFPFPLLLFRLLWFRSLEFIVVDYYVLAPSPKSLLCILLAYIVNIWPSGVGEKVKSGTCERKLEVKGTTLSF